jgi:hypothetical protein
MAHLRRALRWSTVAGVTAAILISVTARSSTVARSDRATTRAYLNAAIAYDDVVLANAGTSKTRFLALASQVAAECPGVIAGSRAGGTRPSGGVVFRGVGELREELSGALRETLLTPDRQAALTFAAKLRTLASDTPAIRSRAQSYAFELAHDAKLLVPKPCADMNSWAASGYRTLPGTTQAFVREYLPPRRLVIVATPAPTAQHIASQDVRCTVPRSDGRPLRSMQAVERTLAASLGSLAATRRELESKLGFRVFRNDARAGDEVLIGVVAAPLCRLLSG